MSMLLVGLLSVFGGFAQHRVAGDTAYLRHNYIEAARQYEQALQTEGKDAHTYYNLGGAYYRLKQYPKAVLAYERCLRLAPELTEARENLVLVRTKLTDRFDAPQESVLTTALRRFITEHDATIWGYWGIASFMLTLCSWGLYFLASSIWMRKLGFFAGIAFFLFTAAFNVFAFAQTRYANAPRMVLMGETTAYSSPSEKSQRLMLLHEGTMVEILATSATWQQVLLPDGKEVWLNAPAGEKL